MRILFVFLVLVLLVSCFPKPDQGKGLLDINKTQDKEETGKLLGTVLTGEDPSCLEDRDCHVGRVCVNGTCVAQNAP